jgi:hypothetical protein
MDPLPLGSEHLESGLVASYLDGGLPPERRARVEAHAAECAACRWELIEVARLLHSRRRRPAWYAGAAAVAAAAVIAILVWPGSPSQPGGAGDYRERAGTTTVAPAALAPQGLSLGLTRLEWTSVPRNRGYHVTLYDDRGSVLWETETSDTVAPLPDRIRLTPGTTYFWRVEARTGWHRWTSSGLTPFSIQPPVP